MSAIPDSNIRNVCGAGSSRSFVVNSLHNIFVELHIGPDGKTGCWYILKRISAFVFSSLKHELLFVYPVWQCVTFTASTCLHLQSLPVCAVQQRASVCRGKFPLVLTVR